MVTTINQIPIVHGILVLSSLAGLAVWVFELIDSNLGGYNTYGFWRESVTTMGTTVAFTFYSFF